MAKGMIEPRNRTHLTSHTSRHAARQAIYMANMFRDAINFEGIGLEQCVLALGGRAVTPWRVFPRLTHDPFLTPLTPTRAAHPCRVVSLTCALVGRWDVAKVTTSGFQANFLAGTNVSACQKAKIHEVFHAANPVQWERAQLEAWAVYKCECQTLSGAQCTISDYLDLKYAVKAWIANSSSAAEAYGRARGSQTVRPKASFAAYHITREPQSIGGGGLRGMRLQRARCMTRCCFLAALPPIIVRWSALAQGTSRRGTRAT